LPLHQSQPCLRAEARRLPAPLSDADNLANWFTLLPGLIGVLLAAPFIFDLEHGTYRLAWTQSITRGRWLLGKLGLPILSALLAGGALILLFTWWRMPNVHINGRLDTGNYDTTGTVVIGYTLFALALALAPGAVWRRAAASLIVAFVGYFAARIFVDYSLRDQLTGEAVRSGVPMKRMLITLLAAGGTTAALIPAGQTDTATSCRRDPRRPGPAAPPRTAPGCRSHRPSGSGGRRSGS
jgi:hypothetical protein